MSGTSNRPCARVDNWYWGLALSLVLSAFVPATALEWSRPALADGELWRLVTGHWVHLSLTHLALNLAGLMVVALLYPQLHQRMIDSLALLTIALLVSTGLYLLSPELTWYRGFSGCLHGLLVYGALRRILQAPLWSLVILVLVAAKLLVEQLDDAMPGVAGAIGGPVIITAHQLGAVGGLLAGATVLAIPSWRTTG
ncbi:rhombosortase [Marinobacter sp. SS21]|uniref:rhombosortase n=1 Tax=Marinobacter sp. SS21 TaxID=2979460 RepID=UPI00232EA4C9|nr:rhombosortase [Marinobacter sp. SS21]MDC0663663.1 rhombosortase [Marinobacter sp. SS21]